jgi:hypothetical protein
MTHVITTELLSMDKFPLLKRLELTDEELDALTRQGFVRSEMRGNKVICRLRYRVHGRQHVRYVSPRDAVALASELASLQRRVRTRRRLADLRAIAREALRHRRTVLAPLFEARGYHFHGYQVRHYRNAKAI